MNLGMSFPETEFSLIQRLAAGGSEEDWRSFLRDYWGPVCRFALRWGAGNLADAEEVAAQTFEVLWENRLLVRWVSNRSSRLRSLLCGVARKLLANRNRTRENRERLSRDLAEHVGRFCSVQDEQTDAFFAAWVEDLVRQAVESLAAEYYGQGKGDYVRVLYGRLCRQWTIAQTAETLEVSPSDVNNYFRHVKTRLGRTLEEMLRTQVARYCTPEDVQQQFALEWANLGSYLGEHGGLEEAVKRAYELLDPDLARQNQQAAMTVAATRLRGAKPNS
jgi:DNA-directed RNA polymerase specialized sigma24 family protein